MTTTAPNAEELRAQLADYEQQIENAERDIGAAALDGVSPAAATKQLGKAREGVGRVEAALAEMGRRAESAERQAAEAAACVERQGNYEWVAEFCRRAEAVFAVQAEARAVEDRFLELRGERGGWKIMNARSHLRGSPTDCDLDTDLVVSIPDFPAPDRGRGAPYFGTWTVERARELRELAELRAAEEASGNGVDRSGELSSRTRERRARRQAEKAVRAHRG